MIEIQEFSLAGGADIEAFLACDKRFQAGFAYQQPGLMRRTLARGASDEWVVVQLWASTAAADGAAVRLGEEPLALEWASFVAAGSIRSRRWVELD